MSLLTERAYAKINLGLRIVARRLDGFVRLKRDLTNSSIQGF